MKTSLFKNLRLQTYLQIINTIIPVITTPYIARVLGATSIGVFSYATSVASFFTLFELLGTYNYGTRTIASEDDLEKKKKLLNEIYLLQIFSCLFATLAYLILCIFTTDNKSIVFLQLVTLFGYFFDVSWFFFGEEDFKTTVTYSFFFRVLSVVALFVFVKSSNDLYIYTIIMLLSASLVFFSLWLKLLLKGYINFRNVRIKSVLKHIKPNIMLFIPIVAMTIYNSMDKVMLGIFSTYEQTGFYYNVDKVINVPFAIITGIGTVLLPRMTVLFKVDDDKAIHFFYDSLSGITMLGTAMCFGIIGIANQFIPIFLGEGYSECVKLIVIFSPILIIKSLSNSIRMQYLVPKKKEKTYIKATTIGAGVNILFNVVLIPLYGALGAIIATITSEIVALVIQIFGMYKKSLFKKLILDIIAYVLIGICMLFVINLISSLVINIWASVIIKVLFGVIIYSILTLLYWIITKHRLYYLYVRLFLNKIHP